MMRVFTTRRSVGLAHAGNQPALFQAVEQGAGHVWVMGDHAVPNAAAGQTLRFGATKNAQKHCIARP